MRTMEEISMYADAIQSFFYGLAAFSIMTVITEAFEQFTLLLKDATGK